MDMGTATLNYVCGCVKLPVCHIKLSFGFLLLIQSTVNLFPRHTLFLETGYDSVESVLFCSGASVLLLLAVLIRGESELAVSWSV